MDDSLRVGQSSAQRGDAWGSLTDTRTRFENLTELVDGEGLAAAVISRPEHLRYFTGLRSGPGPSYLIARSESSLLVTPYAHFGHAVDLSIDVVPYATYSSRTRIDPATAAAETARALLASMPTGSTFGVESDHIPAAVIPDGAQLVDVTATFDRWRAVKHADELAAIRRSVELLDEAFRTVADVLAPGMTELEVEFTVRSSLVPELIEDLRFAGNIATGARSALADPHASDRMIDPGDLVLVDLYPVIDGYHADYTRMFMVAEPDLLQLERYGAVLTALEAAEAMLRPDMPCAEIDRVVRSALADASGLHESMEHHSGHGFGLFAWEDPWLGEASDDVLAVGNVVAVEPGLYVHGWGGIRIEGNYLINEDGFERLDGFPRDLHIATER